jgi:hypothetical protein
MRRLAALVLLGWPLLGLAAEVRAASVEALARSSDLVVRGQVERRTARWSEDGRRIFTFVEVRPTSTWKGRAPATVTVLVPGGVVGRIGQRVDGSPAMEDGEEVVLFLRQAESATWRVQGLAQGKFRIEGSVARPELSGTAVTPGPAPGAGERLAEPMALEELERRVRGAGP